MGLIQIIVVLLVLWLCLYLINQYIPMAPPVKTVINVIVVIILCLWLLQIAGVGNIMIPVRR